MDDTAQAMAKMASGYLADTAFRHLGFVVVALLIIAGLFSFISRRGEKAIGLSIKGGIDAIEAAAKIYIDTKGDYGTVWPLTFVLLSIGWAGVLVAITVIRP